MEKEIQQVREVPLAARKAIRNVKVTFRFSEQIWFKKLFEIEIQEDDLNDYLEEAETVDEAIENFIYENYSTVELKAMNNSAISYSSRSSESSKRNRRR